ncbi:MAG: hypothetical protein HFF54_07605 [Lawsonibacter sp.]|nr:hypothetical protein [Lawsonibacter sp.]
MNDKMPHTPFSTGLSRSAKETEIRIRNIFSGPKKRPPVLFLALMFSICIFCGDLVSCQVAGAEVPDAPDASASAAVLPDDSAPEEPAWTPVELDASLMQYKGRTRDWYYDDFPTEQEMALLEDLLADQLPREAVDINGASKKDYWRDTLLPVAYDEKEDVTVYFVFDPDSVPDAEPLVHIPVWDPEGRGIVLRHRDRAKYFHLCWDGNAKYVSGPTLLVDDFDADGRPEAAVILCLGGGTGAYEEDLYIFDLEDMTYTIPDCSEIPLEIFASPNGNTARLVSGERERKVDLTQLAEPFKGTVQVGNQVRFLKKDGQLVCDLDLDFSCLTLEYLASAYFPVVYEDGTYKLGPAVWMGDIL